MPYIKFWALHGNVQRAIDYIANENKTTDFCVESTSGCDIHTLGLYWKTMDHFHTHTFLNRKSVQGYHTVISFPPTENISPEECFEFAKEYMENSFHKEYDYVISVHNDRGHMHAHIIMHPVSRRTAKTFYPFYKKENNRIRNIVNDLAKEKGYSIIDNQKSGVSYYEWMKKGDTQKEVLRKTIDYIKDKVTSIEEMEEYMTAIGFEFDKPNTEEDEFVFTINEVLIKNKHEDGTVDVYLPGGGRENYIRLNPNQYEVLNDEKTLKAKINIAKEQIPTFDSLLDVNVVMNNSEIKSKFEDKTKKTYSIKVPGGKKYLRTKYLDSDEKYSYSNLKKYIENNGLEKADSSILDVITHYDEKNKETKNANRQKFFESANIKIPFKQSPFVHMTKYEKFLSWKSSDLQKGFDRIEKMRKINESKETRGIIESELQQLKDQYHQISEALKDVEKIYGNMIGQHLEGTLEISQDELSNWVKSYLEPLQKERTRLKDNYTKMKHRMDEYDKIFENKQIKKEQSK